MVDQRILATIPREQVFRLLNAIGPTPSSTIVKSNQGNLWHLFTIDTREKCVTTALKLAMQAVLYGVPELQLPGYYSYNSAYSMLSLEPNLKSKEPVINNNIREFLVPLNAGTLSSYQLLAIKPKLLPAVLGQAEEVLALSELFSIDLNDESLSLQSLAASSCLAVQVRRSKQDNSVTTCIADETGQPVCCGPDYSLVITSPFSSEGAWPFISEKSISMRKTQSLLNAEYMDSFFGHEDYSAYCTKVYKNALYLVRKFNLSSFDLRKFYDNVGHFFKLFEHYDSYVRNISQFMHSALLDMGYDNDLVGEGVDKAVELIYVLYKKSLYLLDSAVFISNILQDCGSKKDLTSFGWIKYMCAKPCIFDLSLQNHAKINYREHLADNRAKSITTSEWMLRQSLAGGSFAGYPVAWFLLNRLCNLSKSPAYLSESSTCCYTELNVLDLLHKLNISEYMFRLDKSCLQEILSVIILNAPVWLDPTKTISQLRDELIHSESKEIAPRSLLSAPDFTCPIITILPPTPTF